MSASGGEASAVRALDEFRTHLRSWAAELSSRSSEPPVRVRDVCKSLRVEISRKNTVPQYKAYLSVDPSRDHPAVILLPAKRIGGFERFCAAHELAHYLILIAFDVTPQGKVEYWKHEELCDEFARHLLIPTHYVKKKVDNADLSTRCSLLLCNEISRSAWVPWIHAALRIAEFRKDITYLRCQRLPSKDFKLVATTHPRRKGRGKLIKRETRLWCAFDELLGRAEQTDGPHRRDVTDTFVGCETYVALGFDENISVIAEAQVREFSDTEGQVRRFADIRIAVGSASGAV
jgi:hypothetical protein